MEKPQKLEDKLYFRYYQFIEFINQYQFSTMAALILVYAPNILILFDILYQVLKNSEIAQNFTSLGVVFILVEVFNNHQIVIDIFMGVTIGMLLLPLIILVIAVVYLMIVDSKNLQTNNNLGALWEEYNIMRWIRIYLRTYKEISFPLIVSIFIKVQKFYEGANQTISIIAIITIICAFLNLFLVIYYELEIYIQRNTGKNYQGQIIDYSMIGLTILCINLAPPLITIILTLGIFALRFLITLVVEIHNFEFQQNRKFSIALICIICFCLLLMNLTNEVNLMLLSCIILVFVIVSMRGYLLKREQQIVDESEELMIEQSDDGLDINRLKKQLWQKQKFIQTFQKLIKLSKQKNSHREHLLIQILKSKCYKKQIINSGGSKVLNPIDLFTYEVYIDNVVAIILDLVSNGEEIFNLMKEKDIYQNIFMDKVNLNRQLFKDAKQELDKALKINNKESKGLFLLQVLCKQLQNDSEYLKQKYESFREQIISQSQLKCREKLFSHDVVLIVINIMEEIGKITQITNNIKNVLGYKSHHLLNLPINGLMPYTIRDIHDEVLKKFIHNFDCRTQRKNPKIESYAYNKEFHLKKVTVEYKFLMNNFQTLSLSGIVQKIKVEETLIFTDQQGNFEGWTKEAEDLLKLEEISGPMCKGFNILPLLPCLIKYQQTQFCCKTLLFKPSKMKNPKLSVLSNMKSWDKLEIKQMEAFNSLLQNEQILDIYLVDIEVRNRYYLGGKTYSRIFQIKRIRQVQNIETILSKLLGTYENESQQKNKKVNIFHRERLSSGEISESSYIYSEKQIPNTIELIFSIDPKQKNKLDALDLELAKQFGQHATFFSNQSIIKNFNTNDYDGPEFTEKQIGIDLTTRPKINKKIKGIMIVIGLSLFLLGIQLYDQINIEKVKKDLKTLFESQKKLARVEMILSKSIFNPNQTYIDEFKAGNLMVDQESLKNSNFNFIEQSGEILQYTYFYLINVQIPSILDSLATSQNSERSQFFRQRLLNNFYEIINVFYEIELQEKQIWKQQLYTVGVINIVVTVITCIGTAVLIGFLIYIKFEESARLKTIEGFFKFQTTDINELVIKIRQINKHLRIKAFQWNIQLKQTVKEQQSKGEVTNPMNIRGQTLEGRSKILDKTVQNTVIKPQRSYHEQSKNQNQIKKKDAAKQSYLGILIIVFFILTQIAFGISYGVMNNQVLKKAETINEDILMAEKCMIQPNLLIANLSLPIPPDVLEAYDNQTQAMIQISPDRLPKFYQFLEEPPCTDCNFLSQILKTNYRSFYSYFKKAIKVKLQNQDSSDIEQLYYAIDLTSDKIYQTLQCPQLPLVFLLIIIYIISMIGFYLALYKTIKQIEVDSSNLEALLLYFDSETIIKNKHLNTMFDQDS